MNQILLASMGMVLAISLVLANKSPSKLLSKFKKDQKASISKNENISLVSLKGKTYTTELNKSKQGTLKQEWKKPVSTQERIMLSRQLLQAISSSPEERLEAIKIACLWGHECTIPILKRGLKDSDFRVVISAAAGIEKFRRNSPLKKLHQVSVSPPRNVSRMR